MPTRRPVAPIACALCCLLSASCASEALLDRSGPTPPWVGRAPSHTDEELLLVGLSVGRNVLDEPAMRTAVSLLAATSACISISEGRPIS